ncbi:dTDP-4-dehydrorhamnose reductase, partial [Chromohalobacter sp. 296-RDG]|uniref:dTDP-4-dehydrorhamnose reductase n=1 Tax=Chromohalobacter sp. 296-RDG TaxID=2994062 RepID=UPI00246840B6
VPNWLITHRPDIIVNAAAYTAVDKAESEPALAARLNIELPQQLASYCINHNACLVHYSSDYVYPGSGDAAWKEDSSTGPLSVYGQTKLEGDQAIEAAGIRHLIFRTSWVYSARGNNFMKTMLRLAREKEALNIVSDQIGAPTPARLIAQVTLLALSHDINPGVYHLAPRGTTSWHGFAKCIFEKAEALGESLKIEASHVASIPTAEYPTPAQRPMNSRLNLDKLESALSITMPTWEAQLELTLKEYLGK